MNPGNGVLDAWHPSNCTIRAKSATMPAMPSSSLNRRRLWVRVVVFAIAVAALFIAVRLLPVAPRLEWFEAQLDEAGALGPLLFAVIYVVAAVLFVPDVLLKVSAGAIFGLFWGLVIASLASAVAAGLAFLIGRHVARQLIAEQTKRFPKFGAVDRAVGKKGWRIVALLRLVPVFPYNVGNYLLGLTSIRFWPYVLASWVAMLPGGFVLVYLGHVGRITLESAMRGEVILEPENLALLVAGLLATVGLTAYLALIAKRAIERHVREEEQEDGGS